MDWIEDFLNWVGYLGRNTPKLTQPPPLILMVESGG